MFVMGNKMFDFSLDLGVLHKKKLGLNAEFLEVLRFAFVCLWGTNSYKISSNRATGATSSPLIIPWL